MLGHSRTPHTPDTATTLRPPTRRFMHVRVGNEFTCAIDRAGREWCPGAIARQPF
jgi:hypothetical protein